MHRLFVALRPPAALREALVSIGGDVPSARWQDDEQLHVTLLFVGEVNRGVTEDIALLLQTVTGPKPTLRIDGLGTFARKGVVHTIWAKLAADEALFRLQQRVARTVGRAGGQAERRVFLPHITLARLGRDDKGVGTFVSLHAGLRSPAYVVDAFYLFESILGAGGATYHVVARYPLAD